MVTLFFLGSLLLGFWIVCSGLAFWLLTKTEDKIGVDEAAACLFGPIALITIVSDHGHKVTVWQKKKDG